jgi:hypothetical protein
MREARVTSADRASVIAWPLAWVVVYYAITLRMVWGRPVHPIQAMFLMFGMFFTALLALATAALWLALLRRRERDTTVSRLRLREVIGLGAASGAAPITVLVLLYQLQYEPLDLPVVLGLVASFTVAGVLSAGLTSGVAAFQHRARERAHGRGLGGSSGHVHPASLRPSPVELPRDDR